MTAKKWILLVEDNANDADLALRVMNTDKFPGEIILAQDGADALDCLRRRGAFAKRLPGNPTVVLLDLKMPRVDGLEVLREIKGDPFLKNIPVVAFTSSAEKNDIARSYELGANGYAVKPLDFRQYRDLLKGIMSFWLAINEPPPEGPISYTSASSHLPKAA